MGHFYRLIENDVDRAKRCYQKALALDPLDGEAGVALSDMYIQSGQNSLAIAIYREAASRSNTIHWAWSRLARYHQVNFFNKFFFHKYLFSIQSFRKRNSMTMQ